MIWYKKLFLKNKISNSDFYSNDLDFDMRWKYFRLAHVLNFVQKLKNWKKNLQKCMILMKLPSLTERIYFHNSANDTHQSNYRYPDDFLKFKSLIELMKP